MVVLALAPTLTGLKIGCDMVGPALAGLSEAWPFSILEGVKFVAIVVRSLMGERELCHQE